MTASVHRRITDQTTTVTAGAPAFRTSAVVSGADDGPLTATLELHGELCPSTAAILRFEVDRLIQDGVIHLTMDLRDLRFCTSHGLDIFQDAHDRVRAGGGSVALIGASGVVRNVLDVVERRDPTFSPTIQDTEPPHEGPGDATG